ncbi:hypothetical protein H8N03_12740 [Ramlibacter sp. USB13]|uniref:Uncharacterized protein n=1 Tax=Ramlibacter cellulosilyticus TaxID=2764187 RepID=A0A923MQW7_9BURK|nr:hypothetical protein [Ramlibacter cellulosilyticus]MBC5783815.1 hypothetical protein [Ramlibacter cellulosilyticus]
MFKNLFGARPPGEPARASSLVDSRMDSRLVDARRELLSVAVRETLRKHGFPQHWVQPETLSVVTRQRERGLQLRLVVREWQPPFLDYCVALQRAIRHRVLRLDPLSASWFTGVTWKFDPVDESLCPALPAVASDWAPLPGAIRTRNDFSPTQPMAREEGLRA